MKFTIVSWNINGIRAAVRKGFTDFLVNKKPHLIGLQEVKIGSSARKKETFDFAKYAENWNSADRPGYAGTMTLLKERSQLEKRFVGHTTGIGKKEFDTEGRVQTLEFDTFYIVNAYFPNTREDLSRLDFKQDFNKTFLKYIKKLDKKKPVIVMGDLNVAHTEIDLARPKPNEGNAGYTDEERSDMSTFLKNGFTDTFRTLNPKKIQYSWWTYRFGARSRNVGWRIDYVLVSNRILKKVKKAFIWDQVQGSDHCPIGIEIDL
ncbi:exodeoxyribonuclease III [Candidatus Parcubacteria bacterium]|nr:MAG: exodeoxyribonuclease III [Candidatus Parcubacteria bacterium]